MSDDDFGFELEPFKNQAQEGLSGTVGVYGRVQVFYVKPVRPRQGGEIFRTEVVSEHLPETHLSGIGMGGKPYLSKKAVLSVGGLEARLVYNVLGFRRTSRALHIGLGDREYTYTSTGSYAFELRRDKARVVSSQGKWVREAGGWYRHGAVQGGVDETDLAVALVFEAVDVSWLSVGGALWSAPFRLLSPQSDGGGE